MGSACEEPEEEGPTLNEWFQAGQRVSCRFYQSLLDSSGRTEHVSCHLIEDLLKDPPGDASPREPIPAEEVECITFLHGFPGCSYDYQPIVQRLLKGRKIRMKLLLFDMLGYGDSDKGVGQARFSIQQHANVLQCIWQRYDIKQSHLVVHDFAVSVAQELLSRQPKGRLPIHLSKVFWLNGSVFIDLYRAPPLQQLLSAPTGWLTARLMSANTFTSSIKQLFSKEHPPSKQALDDIYEGLCNRGGAKIVHKLVRFMKDRRRYKYVWQGALELAMRQDPDRMLFYWGMQDPLSGAHVAAELHKRYEKYGLNITERADLGHMPHLEDPAGVADALVDFLLDPEYTPQLTTAPEVEQPGSMFRVSVSHGTIQTYGFQPSFRRKSLNTERPTLSGSGAASEGVSVHRVGSMANANNELGAIHEVSHANMVVPPGVLAGAEDVKAMVTDATAPVAPAR